jgi:chromosome condensin MukBEF MukE localization factor
MIPGFGSIGQGDSSLPAPLFIAKFQENLSLFMTKYEIPIIRNRNGAIAERPVSETALDLSFRMAI